MQRREGIDFLQWLEDRQALRTGLNSLADCLWCLLEEWVRTKEDVEEVWAAAPFVRGRCNDPDTYGMRGAARAYAWLHLLDRYVRTWLSLECLAKQSILPMGSEGVRVLDVGTGPGPSAFAVHDFFAAMVRYSEGSGSESWRQPARITCVESSVRMNHFRHHLAERLFVTGAPKAILDVCNHIPDFQSISPVRERTDLNKRLRDAYDDYYDEHQEEWVSEPSYTPEEANRTANVLHRYRFFTFSNYLTTKSTVDASRQNLIDILSDTQPGSVLLLIGAKGGHYSDIYRDMAGLARDAGFSREAEPGLVSCSDAEMGEMIHEEGARFYRRLRAIAGDLPDGDPIARKVKREFEEDYVSSPRSAVHAYRKLTGRTDPG